MSRGLQVVPLLQLGGGAHQGAEVGAQVPPQQGLLGRDVQQHGQRVRVEARLQDLGRRGVKQVDFIWGTLQWVRVGAEEIRVDVFMKRSKVRGTLSVSLFPAFFCLVSLSLDCPKLLTFYLVYIYLLSRSIPKHVSVSVPLSLSLPHTHTHTYDEPPVHPAAPQVGGVLRQVHRPQPANRTA